MKIRSLEANGFKGGGSISMDIPDVLVLTGDNGSGKSLIPEAMIVTALGFIPWSRYKTPVAVYENFASKQGLPIQTAITIADTDDVEIPIIRIINRKGGKVTQKLEFMGINKIGEAQAAIDERLKMCAAALDFSKFDGPDMTPRKQMLYLISLAGEPKGYDKNTLLEQVSQSLFNASNRIFKTCENCTQCMVDPGGKKKNDPKYRPEEGPAMGWGECGLEVGKQVKLDAPGCANWEGEEDVWEERQEKLTVQSADIISEVFKAWDDSKRVNDNVEAIEEASRKITSAYSTEAKRLLELSKSQHKAHEKRATEEGGDRGHGTMPEIKSELDAARESEKKLIAGIEKEKAKVKAHVDWLKDHGTFESAVESAERKFSSSNQQMRDAKFETAIKDAESLLMADDIIDQKKSELQALEDKRPDLESAKSETQKIVVGIRAKIELGETGVNVFSSDKAKCPVISGMGCRTTHDQKQGILKDVKKKIVGFQKELKPAVKVADEAKADYEQVVTEIDALTKELSAIDAVNTATPKTIKNLKERRTILQEAIDLSESNVTIAKDSLETHMAKDARIDSSDDTEKLEAEKETVVNEISKLEGIYQVRRDEANADKERETTHAELDMNRDAITLCKELVKIIGPAGILGAVLAAALNPMIKVINECLPDGRKCFIDTTGKDFKIGMTINGDPRSLMSLSDGEKSLFAAAVALAFMVLSGANLKLLIINRFEVIDKKRQGQLLKKIVKASKKHGIQFIACSCRAVPVVAGVKVIDMGGDA